LPIYVMLGAPLLAALSGSLAYFLS
jgi:hypothetical protein